MDLRCWWKFQEMESSMALTKHNIFIASISIISLISQQLDYVQSASVEFILPLKGFLVAKSLSIAERNKYFVHSVSYSMVIMKVSVIS